MSYNKADRTFGLLCSFYFRMKNIITIMATTLSMLLFPLHSLLGNIPVHTDDGIDSAMTGSYQQDQAPDRYELAVELIKKYETLHSPKHWPLVGYGHKVLPGENFSRTKKLTEQQADALLRKDLDKLCAIYRNFGSDSILLAALAYNCGTGTVARSSVLANLKAGNRNIEQSYLSHARYKGKTIPSIRRRRQEELDILFVK